MTKQLSNNKPPAVVFDIDYTVFNTTTFRAHLYERLAKILAYPDKKDFAFFASKLEQETKEKAGYFDPLHFVALLKEKTKSNISVEELTNIFFDESLYRESIYTDARGVFQELVMKRDIPVLIFSTGAKKFQLYKLSVLKEMLTEDKIHIFVDKLKQLKDFLAAYDAYHLYLIDDLPTVLKEAKAYNPTITTVWINRDPSVTEKDFVHDFRADHMIKRLEEIIPLVTNQ